MAISPFIFDGGLLTGAAAAQGSAVPVSTKRLIKAATITNTTGAPVQATVHLVPSGAAPSTANTMISARPIAAGESYPCPELAGQGLNAGGTVQALGAGLTFKYSATDFI